MAALFASDGHMSFPVLATFQGHVEIWNQGALLFHDHWPVPPWASSKKVASDLGSLNVRTRQEREVGRLFSDSFFFPLPENISNSETVLQLNSYRNL